MADMKLEVFQLRRRIAELQGQRNMADAEIMRLREIPCPNCDGKGGFEEERENNTTLYKNCTVCNGSGKACGERSQY